MLIIDQLQSVQSSDVLQNILYIIVENPTSTIFETLKQAFQQTFKLAFN